MCKYNIFNGYVGNKAAYICKIKAFFDGSCKEYIEPFIGGGALFFSNYNGQFQSEWINDKNSNIANLYQTLADRETQKEVYEALLSIGKDDNEQNARLLFKEAKQRMQIGKVGQESSKEKRIERSVDTFRVYSQSFNCAGRNYSRHKSNEKYKYETKRNIENVIEKMKMQPKISCRNGIDIIKETVNNPKVQLLIDPPYVGLYRNESNLYAEEMPGLLEHIALVMMLQQSKAAAVLCGYRPPIEGIPCIYDAILSEDWHCYKLADTNKKSMVVKTGGKKQGASEFIWTNRVPEHAGLYMSLDDDYKEKITMKEYWDRIRGAVSKGILPAMHVEEYSSVFRKLYNKEL